MLWPYCCMDEFIHANHIQYTSIKIKSKNIDSYCEIIWTWSVNPMGSWIIFLNHLWIHNVPVRFDVDTMNIINVTTLLLHGQIFITKLLPLPLPESVNDECSDKVEGSSPCLHWVYPNFVLWSYLIIYI